MTSSSATSSVRGRRARRCCTGTAVRNLGAGAVLVAGLMASGDAGAKGATTGAITGAAGLGCEVIFTGPKGNCCSMEEWPNGAGEVGDWINSDQPMSTQTA